jgi:hypothetical protein
MMPKLQISTSYECPELSIHINIYTLKDLRRYVVRSATHGFPPLCIEVESCSKSEIPDLNIQFLREEQVAQFEVPVYDLVLMDIFDTQSYLVEVIFCLNFGDSLATLYQLVQCLV